MFWRASVTCFQIVSLCATSNSDAVAQCELAAFGPPEPEEFDSFGASVAICGEAVLVGAPFYNSFAGAGFAYRFNGREWELEGILGTGKTLFLGGSVAMENTLATLGYGPGLGGPVPIYRFDGTEWNLEDTIAPTDPQVVSFGETVAITNGQVMISGWLATGSGTVGAVFLYEFSGTRWLEATRLTPSETSGENGLGLGYSVSTFEDLVVIGAPGDDGFGSAYVFRLDGSQWAEEVRLTASDAQPHRGTEFGRSASVHRDRVLIGAACCTPFTGERLPPAAYIFHFDGVSWVEETKLTHPTDPSGAQSQFFAQAVAIEDDLALIGSNGEDSGWGATYVYRFDGDNWVAGGTIQKPETLGFGWSLAIDNHIAAIGAFPGGAASVIMPSRGCTSLSDYARFQNCFTGVNPSAVPDCVMFDADIDGAIDLSDFRRLLLRLKGP